VLRSALAIAIVGLAACSERAAESVPAAEPLGAMIDEFAEPFTGPIRMVELRDGRLLLMDTRERRLLRVDLTSGAVDTISRQGDGPLEYRSMFVLARAPGDSVWGFDLLRRQIVVFSPDGEPARGFSTLAGDDPMQRMNSPWLRTIDSTGRWLGRGQRFSLSRPFISDTVVVLRTTPVDHRVDTVATLATSAPKQNADGSSVITNFADIDAWAAFSDGLVLVLRGATYDIELHHPDGRMESVGVVPHRRVALTTADAERLRDSVARELGALVSATMASIPGSQNRPRPPTHVLPDPLPTNWRLLVDEDGIAVDRQDRAWVRVRSAAFDTGAARFDLLGRNGRFIKAVQVPAGEVLVGFGRDVVYVARRDEDDLLRLRRYPLP
jgi:hypothetical protein